MPSNALNDAKSSAAIYSQLKTMVLNHAFSPSQQLQPWSLADAFKVSATPVREALIRLNAEGLVVVYPNKGFFMKPLNIAESRELYTLRSQLLKCSIEHIIDHAARETVSALVGTLQVHLLAMRMVESDAALRLELIFEECLHAAGSSVCFEVVHGVHEKTRYLRSLFVEDGQYLDRYLEIVGDIATFIQEREKKSAFERLRDELEFKLDCVPKLCDAGLVRAFRCQ